MYRKKIFLILLFTLILFNPLHSFAQDSSTETDADPTKRLFRESLKTTIEQQRSELKTTVSQMRENFKIMLEEKRKEASESFKQKREEFNQRLQTIRDEKKKLLVERINNKLENINKRRTDHMMSVLDRLSSILDRLKQRVDTAKTAGKDTTSLEQAIEAAQTKISEAEAAVTTQAGKVYVAEIVDETTLRETVGEIVSQFQTELRDVHKLVVDARQVVMNAVKEAAKLGKANEVSTPTP